MWSKFGVFRFLARTEKAAEYSKNTRGKNVIFKNISSYAKICQLDPLNIRHSLALKLETGSYFLKSIKKYIFFRRIRYVDSLDYLILVCKFHIRKIRKG